MESQAQIFRNLSAVLEKAGSSLEKAIKVNVFLANMEDFAAMNEIYGQFLNHELKPVSVIVVLCVVRLYNFTDGIIQARTCVSVKALPLGTDVEIECSAFI